MEKKVITIFLNLLVVLTLIFIFNFSDANAHKKKNHKPMICIPEEERKSGVKNRCSLLLKIHRLCKEDQDCAILKLEAQQEEIKGLEDRLGGVADCGDIPFNHKSSADTTVHKKPNADSEVVSKVKKNQKLLFFAPSEKNKNWYFVKIKKDKSCADGYIQQKFVVKKDAEDTVVKVGPKLIEINEPRWAKEGKLILVDAEGTVSISGAIQEGKIDQIIINEEEEIINGDNTFTYLLFVPNGGAEVRIVGNKNGKKVKELIFTIKVGN
jgi:hypothetical protein